MSETEKQHLSRLFLYFPPGLSQAAPLQDPMITGQLSKPLLSLRSEMSAAELRADDKAPASPDSELNDDPLLLSSDANDREDTPNKLYGESAKHLSISLSFCLSVFVQLVRGLTGEADASALGASWRGAPQ